MEQSRFLFVHVNDDGLPGVFEHPLWDHN